MKNILNGKVVLQKQLKENNLNDISNLNNKEQNKKHQRLIWRTKQHKRF